MKVNLKKIVILLFFVSTPFLMAMAQDITESNKLGLANIGKFGTSIYNVIRIVLVVAGALFSLVVALRAIKLIAAKDEEREAKDIVVKKVIVTAIMSLGGIWAFALGLPWLVEAIVALFNR